MEQKSRNEAILELLNCRVPRKEIARRVGCSAEIVKYVANTNDYKKVTQHIQERRGTVLELQSKGFRSHKEIAALLGVSVKVIKQDWKVLKETHDLPDLRTFGWGRKK